MCRLLAAQIMAASKNAVAARAREALAAAQKRSGVGELSEEGKELARRKAAEALKAAVCRSGPPETRRRSVEDRASKALSQALARQSCSAAPLDNEQGVMGEFAAEAWVQDVASVDANMLGFSWGEESLGTAPYDGHWHQENLAGSETALGGQTFWPEVPEDDSWAWQAEGGVFPGQEFLITQGSSTWAGKDATFGMPTDGSMAANRQTMWGVARCFATWGEEASEGIRGAWTETATTAASTRSAASAADSASDIDHANVDDDAEEAEELLASCWKVVTQV